MAKRLTSLFAALAIAAPAAAYAQTADNTVSGRILDSGGAPLAAASVVIIRPGETAPLSAALTGADGRFSLSGLPTGDFILQLSEAGFEAYEEALLIGARNQFYDVGDVRLTEAQGITVLAERVRTGLSEDLDRQVYRAHDFVAQSGGSLLNAMKTLPGVTIDQNGVLTLRGSDRVAVLVDGRPSGLTGFGNQQALDNIPIENIERIEIINNPSARHDAAGMAGIINIIYAQNAERGLSGDYGLTIGVGALSKRRDDNPSDLGSYDTNERITPSLNLNYTTERQRYFLQAETTYRHDLPNNEFTARFYDDGRIISSQVPENRLQNQYIVRAGIDHERANGDTLSASINFDTEHHRDEAQVPYIDLTTGQRLRYWFWNESETTSHLAFISNYVHQFDEPGHKLTINLQYVRGREDETYRLNEDSPTRVGSDLTHIDAIENTLPLQVDYVRPLAQGRVELGARAQARWIPVEYDVIRGFQSVIYPGLGDTSEWRENILALYGNYVHERPRYAIEAGFRVEQTNVEYDIPADNIYYPTSDSYDYFDAFPNVRLTYKLSDDDTLSAFYNYRIDRPGEPELRIFPKYDDPELLKVGNPYLRPQYTQNFELAYQHRADGGSYSVALFHRRIEDAFVRIFAIDSTTLAYDVVNKIFQNVGEAQNTGVELIAQRDFGSALRLSGSVNVFSIQRDPFTARILFPFARDVAVEGSDDTTWDAKLTATYTFPDETEVQLTGVYYAERSVPQGTRSTRSSIDFGLTRPIFDDAATLTFSATDIFNQFGIEERIRGDGFDALYQNFYQTQSVSLGVKVDF